MTILLDIAPSVGGIGIFAAVAFFLVFIAIAFIAYKMMKRTVKMAFRMAIVAVIVAVAIAGSTFFMLSGSTKPARPEPRSAQTR